MATKKPKKRWQPNDSKVRWKEIEKKFGLSRDDYLKILSEQGGVCYICHKAPKDCRPKRNLAVDHDHRSGRIRGLLCFNCNHKVLGWLLKDDVEVAKRIVVYLTRGTDYGKVPNDVKSNT